MELDQAAELRLFSGAVEALHLQEAPPRGFTEVDHLRDPTALAELGPASVVRQPRREDGLQLRLVRPQTLTSSVLQRALGLRDVTART